MQEETLTPFNKVSEKEYQIKIDGKYRTINCSFGKTKLLFSAFISNGGIIDVTTGQVQTDIISLISSFGEVGDILLSEYDHEGKLVTQGNCSVLTTSEVVNLFLLSTSIVEGFTRELGNLQKAQTPTPEN